MQSVDPDLKFMAISLAHPSSRPEMFEYFLDPAHHKAGIPIDFITYHFYAEHSSHEGIDNWQYTFFNQAAGFLDTVRYVENIRKRLNPSVRTDLNELGVILYQDSIQRRPGFVYKPEPEGYFALAGALYAHLYIELARLGIDVIGESQLVGYPSQYPSVTMIDHTNSQPNARFWVLKLLHDNFSPGDKLYTPSGTGEDIAAEGFDTTHGRRMLVVNRRAFATDATLPAEFANSKVAYVAASTGDRAPVMEKLDNRTIHLRPFETAVLSLD